MVERAAIESPIIVDWYPKIEQSQLNQTAPQAMFDLAKTVSNQKSNQQSSTNNVWVKNKQIQKKFKDC